MKTKTTKTKTVKNTTTNAAASSPVHEGVAAATLVPAMSPSIADPAVVAAPVDPLYAPPGEIPPAPGVIATPEGWRPTPKKRKSARGQRPRGAQVTDAAAAAKEISQSATYTSDFGAHAPTAGQIAFVVNNAASWRARWQAAQAFTMYCSEQRATWETAALAQMDTLKPLFDFLAQREPKVAEKYPVTGKYLGVGSTIARRASESRKAKVKTQTKTKAGATAAPAAAPDAPATGVKAS